MSLNRVFFRSIRHKALQISSVSIFENKRMEFSSETEKGKLLQAEQVLPEAKCLNQAGAQAGGGGGGGGGGAAAAALVAAGVYMSPDTNR
jgi:hypothetical protein